MHERIKKRVKMGGMQLGKEGTKRNKEEDKKNEKKRKITYGMKKLDRK